MVRELKIVEEVSGWLKVFEDGSVDRTGSCPPEIKFMTEPVPTHPHFIDGVATRDVTINPTSGRSVRIYKPKQALENQTKLPIVLHFHGGGFCISEASWRMYYNFYTKLAKSVPAIIVSVYLRLAPEHRLPAACYDGFEALLWLQSLAEGRSHEPWLNENGDFSRVFLIGDSAGGNIVHDVAARAGHEIPDMGPLKLAGGIPIHPGFLRAKRSKSELEQPQSPMLTLEMVDKFLKLALPLNSTKDHPLTCPMGADAPPLEGLKLPPYLLWVAENDLLKDTEMEFYEAMKKAGKDIELMMNYGMGHCFYLNKIAVDKDSKTGAQTSRLLQEISEFIRKH